ncbi:MAG: LysM peptidoglycan-binding domain-containing protein [Peptoniphilaceae bacterium]
MKNKSNYRKIKLNKFRCLLFIIIIFIFSTGLNVVNLEEYFNKDKNNNKIEYYRVSQNDTLWSISGKFYKNIDKRTYIKEIKRINHISDKIYPGEVILIPTI